MDTRFTPGPWKVVPFIDPYLCIPDVVSKSKISVCTCYNGSVGCVTQTNANARLIAAAPDLYAACKELLGQVDPCPDDVPMSARCRVCGMHPTKHERDCVVLTARAALAKARGE